MFVLSLPAATTYRVFGYRLTGSARRAAGVAGPPLSAPPHGAVDAPPAIGPGPAERAVDPAQRRVDDPRAIGAGPVERVDHPVPLPCAGGAAVAVVVGEDLQLHRFGAGSDAADADPVAVERDDRAGDMRAVPVVVDGG